MGLPVSAIKKGIENLKGVPGRLEPIANEAGLSVFVDYAHTPEALESVLAALKTLTSGRVITVFGCGGDRDPDKRPMMGAAAVRHSELAVLTSDNPRTEDPEAILSAMVDGAASVGNQRYRPHELPEGFGAPGYVVEPDRRRAIEVGLRAARRGDTVLIAGKGHETYQIIGGKTIPFDDRMEARTVLERLSAEEEQ
jgi:UDP-N-acetylmuramoyl-L-alanyl-D-glutamate--2,6-diaminopimelate ligase/murE/murF fusion protein